MRDACFPSLVAHSRIHLTFRDVFQALRSMRATLSIVAVCALACSAPALAQETRITASNADNGDSFGWDVAIDGDTMVIGSRSEDQANLKASNAKALDVFGQSVDISGDTDEVSIFGDVIGPGGFGARLSYRLLSRENPSSAA